MTVKHSYKGWTITKCNPPIGRKTGHKYIAERDSDDHLAPEHYDTLREAKTAIDNGSAECTPVELKARQYVQEWALSPEHMYAWLEQRDYALGDKAAALAIKLINTKKETDA